jgi:hypothetical protein
LSLTQEGILIYTPTEIGQLRRAIGEVSFLDEPKARSMSDAVASGRCPPDLAPFWEMAEAAPTLWQKLGRDELVETYSIYGFFPGIYEMVYLPDSPAGIAFDGRTRGRVALVRGPEKGLVVKPWQSRREGEIAGIAADLGVGPRQYPSLPGFLTEELCPGVFFTELPPEGLDDARSFQLGRTLGEMLARLHSRRIYYNDATISDPEGRSHLLVSSDGRCRLIDFGVSVLLDHHPRLTGEEVYNCARTLPMFRIMSGMGLDQQGWESFLRDYGRTLAATPVEEIMARDRRFAEEGLAMAAQRLGEGIVGPFRRGFSATFA